MKPISFKSKTTPWVVFVPASAANGKRKAKYFKSKKEADAFCVIGNKPGFRLDGFVSPVSKTEQAGYRSAVEYAKAKLGDQSLIYQAIDYFKKTKLNIKPATVREALELFYAARQGKFSKSTIETDRTRLNKLERAFRDIQLSDLTAVTLREFFESFKGNPRSLYKSTRVFFGWAFDHGYLAENPMVAIKPVGEFGVNNDYYPVETFRRMLRVAAGLDPVKPGGETTNKLRDLLPWFVVSGFLGLRSHEARRETREADSIRWSDLHWDAKIPFVEVRADVAKGRKGHDIETSHYLEAAKAWLEFYGRPEVDGPIVPWTKRQIQELKRDFKKATGMRFTDNGLRNSFATYALTFNGLQGVGKLALEMGNSERVCHKHYIRKIEPGSGEAWFNLRPPVATEPTNVIQMEAA